MCIYIYMCVCACTCARIPACTYSHAHICTCIFMHTCLQQGAYSGIPMFGNSHVSRVTPGGRSVEKLGQIVGCRFLLLARARLRRGSTAQQQVGLATLHLVWEMVLIPLTSLLGVCQILPTRVRSATLQQSLCHNAAQKLPAPIHWSRTASARQAIELLWLLHDLERK